MEESDGKGMRVLSYSLNRIVNAEREGGQLICVHLPRDFEGKSDAVRVLRRAGDKIDIRR